MIEVEVSFLDCSIECLHLDSLDKELRLDVLVLFGPDCKAGDSGAVSLSLRKPELWGHRVVQKVKSILTHFFSPLVAFNSISPSTDALVSRKVPVVLRQHIG